MNANADTNRNDSIEATPTRTPARTPFKSPFRTPFRTPSRVPSRRLDSPITVAIGEPANLAGPATTATMDTAELLEMILLQLDFKTLLLVQRVSKAWHAQIERSRPMQKKLFKLPVSAFSEAVALGMADDDAWIIDRPKQNMVLNSLLFTVGRIYPHGSEWETELRLRDGIVSELQSANQVDGSWLQMYLSQPSQKYAGFRNNQSWRPALASLGGPKPFLHSAQPHHRRDFHANLPMKHLLNKWHTETWSFGQGRTFFKPDTMAMYIYGWALKYPEMVRTEEKRRELAKMVELQEKYGSSDDEDDVSDSDDYGTDSDTDDLFEPSDGEESEGTDGSEQCTDTEGA